MLNDKIAIQRSKQARGLVRTCFPEACFFNTRFLKCLQKSPVQSWTYSEICFVNLNKAMCQTNESASCLMRNVDYHWLLYKT